MSGVGGNLRDVRLQAAVVRDGRLLLVRMAPPDEPAFWAIPGGGREPGESDEEAVAREAREEVRVEVEVGPMLCDLPADPPDGTYTRWRTFLCRITRGEPAAGGDEGWAVLTAVRWVPLDDEEEWGPEVRDDLYVAPQLRHIREALRME